MIRALRPTDVLAYLAFHNRLPRGRHDPRDRVAPRAGGAVGVVVGFFGRSLALESGRETWVQIDNGRISGLVASKRREGADIWDVDQLTVLPSADSSRTASRLLEQLLSAAVDEGIHKVFLRLDEGDPAQDWVRQVGFFSYCQETTYIHPEVPAFARPVVDQRVRRRRPSDHHALFQLYCSAVPFRVRQAEGMTLHEWRWTDGWAVRPAGIHSIIGTARSDYVLDSDPRLAAWIQVDQSKRRLTLLTDDNLDVGQGDLVTFGLGRLGSGGPAWCAVRDYQGGLAC
ncbi:MAG TPA: GNAT family N-acetyltransferase, partial [Chloroflexota bacterium]|nr:GNAT family N-acetyltransferase [Chloroflexota bacterium]